MKNELTVENKLEILRLATIATPIPDLDETEKRYKKFVELLGDTDKK